MRVRYAVAAAIAAFSLLLAGCGSGEDAAPEATRTPLPAPTATPEPAAEAAPVLPASVTDVNGELVTVTDVSRIIPLNGDIAETVFELGLGDNIVGVDLSATRPAELQETLPSIGYQRTLSAEGIISLNPTVIIGSEDAGPPEVIEQIKGIGIPVVIIKSTSSIDEVGDKLRAVAAALGVPQRGEDLAATAEEQIQGAKDLAAKATTAPKVMFLYLRGSTTQMIMGQGSGADSLIVAAGASDVGADSGIQGAQPITPEALVAAQPEVLLVLSAGLESVGGVDGLLAIPGIAETPAGQNRSVVDFDDQYLLGLGPHAGEALMDLVKALHPELA